MHILLYILIFIAKQYIVVISLCLAAMFYTKYYWTFGIVIGVIILITLLMKKFSPQ